MCAAVPTAFGAPDNLTRSEVERRSYPGGAGLPHYGECDDPFKY